MILIIIQTEVNDIYRRLRRITFIGVWLILDIIRKPNPIIVLFYIQNYHTKMQAKCGSKESCDRKVALLYLQAARLSF